jgi:hypothetical protein
LKIFAQAQFGARTVRRLAFSNNPANKSRARDYNTLYGYLFTHAGATPKALIINLGPKPMPIDLSGLGFTPKTAGHTSAPSLATPITDDDSVSQKTTSLTGQKTLALPPCSVTLLQ